MTTIYTHAAYLFLSLSFTIWVAQTLFKNGRIFLVDSFNGHEELADSVNHLLLVGFYLINIGYVSFFLKYGERPRDATMAIEVLSSKIGLVLVVLGVMHFLNLYIFSRMRRRAMVANQEPPVQPQKILKASLLSHN